MGTAARFYTSKSIAIDQSGNLFIGDTSNRQVRVVTPSGAVFTVAGTGDSGNVDGTGATAQFSSLGVLAIDDNGVLYVASSWTPVRKISL